VPSHWGKTIKELCGECRATKAKRCGKGQVLSLLGPAGAVQGKPGIAEYDGFKIENCESSPKHQDLAPHVIWDSVYCEPLPPVAPSTTPK
jgi:hypothetical protein